ncbi:MAG TPA: hypothetical protein VF702_03280 [Allosphingosinicella sp.]|jgi:hypothetical protein
MYGAELFVPIGGMLMIVTITSLITRLLASMSLNRTIREAIRSHPESVAPLADRLDARPLWGDFLLGFIFLAFAIGLVLLGLTEADEVDRARILRGAIVPTVVGLTVLVWSWFASRGAGKAG